MKILEYSFYLVGTVPALLMFKATSEALGWWGLLPVVMVAPIYGIGLVAVWSIYFGR